jgi:hypothetical protein
MFCTQERQKETKISQSKNQQSAERPGQPIIQPINTNKT